MARRTQAQKDLDAAISLQGTLDALGSNVGKVLGLDLSYRRPGFAVIYPDGQVHAEHLDVRRLAPNERLKMIGGKVLQLALGGHENYPADIIFVEQAFATDDNGTKTLLAHGAARAMLAAGGWRGPIVEVHNARLKAFAVPGLAPGSGKDPMINVARQRFGLATIDPDEADAVIAAAFGWSLLGVHFGDQLARRPQWEIPAECMATVIKMATGKAPARPKRKAAA